MRNRHIAVDLAIFFLSVAPCVGQRAGSQNLNTKLTLEEFRTIAAACAPDIPLVTLRAIARAESGFYPYALSIDYPRRIAREHGFKDGEIFLARQPKNLEEARVWTHWLLQTGQSVSIGLVQISTQHALGLGLRVDQLFDPCTNVHAGARILKAKYQRSANLHGEGQEALLHALSEYNSGSSIVGFDNGYVSNVVNGESHARRLEDEERRAPLKGWR